MLHLVCRNFVLRTDLRKESPLTKLGGSMAISDASVAALVSVTVAPLLAASNRDFDAIARLFCGILVIFFVLPRLWAGATASALLANTTSQTGGFDRAYPIVPGFPCQVCAVAAREFVGMRTLLAVAFVGNEGYRGKHANLVALVVC